MMAQVNVAKVSYHTFTQKLKSLFTEYPKLNKTIFSRCITKKVY
jgi:hypothetical protein